MKPDFKKILFDSSKLTIDIAAETVGNNPEYFKEVLNFASAEKSPLNMRASRVIVSVCEKYPGLFLPYVNITAEKFRKFKTDGQKRAFAYILSKYAENIEENNRAGLIDVCFDYMFSNEKVAVKYNCLILLFEFTKIYPELKNELLAAIDFNLTEGIFKLSGMIKRIYGALNENLTS
ncbi:MAG: hypothetical protein GXO50_08655 [Chlorobi bacterium]|nr:hypothetical protein [Chlorobiota bacterium]